MISRTSDSLRYFQFASLNHPALRHAVFTRHGGVSPAPWESLNLSAASGDHADRVLENERRALKALGRSPTSGVRLTQVHSRDVVRASRGRTVPPDVHADAVITDDPAATLCLRFADCAPVLMYDPVRQAVGLAHAGWKGTVLKIASATVQAMVDAYDTKPGDLLAAIGPAIGPDHYPVGPEVVEAVRAAYAAHEQLLLYRDGQFRLDLAAANRQALVDAGVEQIEVTGVCTACQLQDFYSHRGEGGRTGRFGVLLALSG